MLIVGFNVDSIKAIFGLQDKPFRVGKYYTMNAEKLFSYLTDSELNCLLKEVRKEKRERERVN